MSSHTLGQVERLAAKYPAAEILLAFDNDPPGDTFAALVEKTLAGREGVRRLRPRLKDWNDQLREKAAVGVAPSQPPAP